MNKPMLEDKDKVAKVYNSKGEVCETFSFRDHGNSYLSAAQNYLMQNYDKLMAEEVEQMDEGNKENKKKKNEYVSNIIKNKLSPKVLPSLKYGRQELKKEEVEQMDEISQDLALRAHAKANDVTSRRWNDKFAGADLADKGSQGMFHHSSSGEEAADRTAKRLRERIGRKFGPEAEARAKRSEFGVVAPANTTPKKKSFLSRLGLTKEEVEQMDEVAPPGREKQVKALKGKVDNPYAVAWASYNKSKAETKSENTMYNNMLTKLEEGKGRGRPPTPGSEAWKRRQSAAAEGKTIDEVPALGFQLLKHKDQGERGSGMIKFKDGSSHKISAQHRDKALRFMSSLLGAGKDPVDRQQKIKNMSNSHDQFLQHIGEKPMQGPEKRHPMSAIPKEDPADEKRK